MNEQRQLLAQTVEPLFEEIGAAPATPGAWERVAELGIADLLLGEDSGGFGGGWEDAYIVFRAGGLQALPLPVAETVVARRLLADAGIAIPDGALTLAVAASGAHLDPKGRVHAELRGVAWPQSPVLTAIAGDGGDRVLLLDPAAATVTPRDGADGEPRADLRFADASAIASVARPGAVAELATAGALLRASQMAGALESLLTQSIAHVNERVQFGRSLSKFQVIQHQMALLAEEAAAVGCAARAACLALDRGEPGIAIACAKLRANRAVQQATSIAHQVHGAIGITHEHRLHLFTQRLWHWRADFGNDRQWAAWIGRRVIAGGAAGVWPLVTGTVSPAVSGDSR